MTKEGNGLPPAAHESKWFETLAKHLGPHGPDALLIVTIFVGSGALLRSGLDPWIVIPFALILVSIYAWRQTQTERHRERIAEIDVKKMETDIKILREQYKLKASKKAQKGLVLQTPQKGEK